MSRRLDKFESIARALAAVPNSKAVSVPVVEAPPLDPFDARNIHPDLPPKVRELFDDGHYPEATSLAFKFLDKKVHKLSNVNESGHKLMMAAFSSTNPKLKLNT